VHHREAQSHVTFTVNAFSSKSTTVQKLYLPLPLIDVRYTHVTSRRRPHVSAHTKQGTGRTTLPTTCAAARPHHERRVEPVNGTTTKIPTKQQFVNIFRYTHTKPQMAFNATAAATKARALLAHAATATTESNTLPAGVQFNLHPAVYAAATPEQIATLHRQVADVQHGQPDGMLARPARAQYCTLMLFVRFTSTAVTSVALLPPPPTDAAAIPPAEVNTTVCTCTHKNPERHQCK
jgi:hypothetical protein